MNVKLNKQDFVRIVNGSEIPSKLNIESDIYECVVWINDSWAWDVSKLEQLSIYDLYKMYKLITL
jgi:hypothetical protein